MNVEEFKKYVRENDANQINNEGLGEIFEDMKGKFSIICVKCGSLKVQIIGEDGVDYGEFTGYDPGSNVVKCLACGNAVTIWK